jgi:hypothetical protein
MQPFAIPDYAAVKRVKGTILTGFGAALHKLSFFHKDGTEITKVELANDSGYGPEFVLDDSEEIIGIFGTKDLDSYMQLGFIVWKPPQF